MYCEDAGYTRSLNMVLYSTPAIERSGGLLQGLVELCYTNNSVANYKGEMYNLPFNSQYLHKICGGATPSEGKAKIEERDPALPENPKSGRAGHQPGRTGHLPEID